MNEAEYLQAYRKEDFDRPSVTVDLVLLTIREDQVQVLLTRRQEHPFQGMLALPGVFVGIGETLDAAAERALSQKTGLSGIYFEQLYTWGAPDRDPRMRVISVSYCALVPWESISHPSRPLRAGAHPQQGQLYGHRVLPRRRGIHAPGAAKGLRDHPRTKALQGEFPQEDRRSDRGDRQADHRRQAPSEPHLPEKTLDVNRQI